MTESAYDTLLRTSRAVAARDVPPRLGTTREGPLGQTVVDALHAEARALWKALSVIVLDTRSRQWLTENDPKALEQAEAALLGRLP